jgi:hypothetical protein
MSHVTNYLLLAEEWNEKVFAHLNKILNEEGGQSFRSVRESAGGQKVMEADVWLCAGNYLQVGDVTKAMRQVRWTDPDCVQLLVKDQHEETWSFVDWRNP